MFTADILYYTQEITQFIPEELVAEIPQELIDKYPLIKERLLKHDIVTGPFEQDPYTGQRQLSFAGPDGVIVTILEEEV